MDTNIQNRPDHAEGWRSWAGLAGFVAIVAAVSSVGGVISAGSVHMVPNPVATIVHAARLGLRAGVDDALCHDRLCRLAGLEEGWLPVG